MLKLLLVSYFASKNTELVNIKELLNNVYSSPNFPHPFYPISMPHTQLYVISEREALVL